jgi:hypothetical protein
MMDWQQHSDFLQAWPELHSLLAAYIAIEEEDERHAIKQFVDENPNVLARVITQLNQVLESNNPQFYQQAARLAGRDEPNQAWLQMILQTLKQAV